jgi:hypothetical protein
MYIANGIVWLSMPPDSPGRNGTIGRTWQVPSNVFGASGAGRVSAASGKLDGSVRPGLIEFSISGEPPFARAVFGADSVLTGPEIAFFALTICIRLAASVGYW